MKVLSPKEYDNAIQTPDSVLIAVLGDCKHFPDDLIDTCDKCNQIIHYRPYNKKCTHKLCVVCANEMIEKKMEIDEFLKETKYHG